jgi:hypothetical protein
MRATPRQSADARLGRAAGVRQRAIGSRVAPASVKRQQRHLRYRVPCAPTAATADCCPLSTDKPASGAGSVERAGGEHEAGRCPRFGPAAGVKTRSVQAVSGRCLHCRLGFPTVGDDPRHDRLEVSPFGDDRGPLDDGAARVMNSGQSSDQRPNRFVVHACHGSPFPGIRSSPWRQHLRTRRGAAARAQAAGATAPFRRGCHNGPALEESPTSNTAATARPPYSRRAYR